ncbi:MAG: aconitase X, partial [Roseobacter sp.]
VMDSLVAEELDRYLEDLGVEFVVDTCVVVTPILPEASGVLMTNSAKFAHYATGNTGYLPAFGSLADCVASAQAGHLVQNDTVWA